MNGEVMFGRTLSRPGVLAHEEITLRDYFAAAALTGLLAYYREDTDAHDCAAEAYRQADAMLAEREK